MNYHKTDINGGQGLVWDDMRWESAACRNGFYGLASALGIQPRDSFVLSGCNVTDNTDGTFTIAAGFICINGEICQVLQHTTEVLGIGETNIWVIEESDDPAGVKTFADSTTHDTYKIRTAIVQGANVSPGGDFLPMQAPTFYDRLNKNNPRKRKVVNIGTWNMDSALTKTVAHGITGIGVAGGLRITGAYAVVYSDDDLADRLAAKPYAGFANQADITEVNETSVILEHASGSPFNTNNYDSTSANRGHIVIDYEPIGYNPA